MIYDSTYINLFRIKTVALALVVVFISQIIFLKQVSASAPGGIDSTYKYAWGENTGWINFGASGSNVLVTDTAITGYAWSDNYGWINLNPPTAGVVNTINGTLSGKAWAEQLGWIDFSGVTIDNNGYFSGYATIDIDNSQISFNCSNGSSCGSSNFKVKTNWLANSPTPSPNVGGGGGTLQITDPPFPPLNVLINNGDIYTSNHVVNLNLQSGSNTTAMAVSVFPDFRDTGQEPYVVNKSIDLCKGLSNCDFGEYTVYVKFYTQYGYPSQVVSDNIIYKETTIPEKVIDIIPKIFKPLVPNLFKPEPIKHLPEIPLEDLLPKETPLSFRGNWNLISYTSSNLSLEKFVLAPLPKEIRSLTQKFPNLDNTFKTVGISKLSDLDKLLNVNLTLPGITQIAGSLNNEIKPNNFESIQGIPIANLSPTQKQNIPTEIVFAKTSNGLIDYNIILSLNDKGETQQRIETISGKLLQLSVKPDSSVNSVKGYVVLKSRTKTFSSGISLNSLMASAIFAKPVLSQVQEQPINIEERMVLSEFEYTDPDKDGIYTAEIQAPVVDGEYEIITVLDFNDPELGRKQIRLIAVVDPEGYIYEKNGDKETRVPGAIVSIFKLNNKTKQYELWQADDYQQENPQVTDVRGVYSFLVPEGFYYIKVEAPGYLVSDGKPFEVKSDSGVHFNIQLQVKYWWLKIFNWNTVLLLIIAILLLYNFYRDKIRDRFIKSK